VSAKILTTWEEHLTLLRRVVGAFPDRRTGDNTSFTMEDIGLGAFSVFFMQCPSFLAHQKTIQQARGQSNAQSLFQLEQIPSDNPIRQTLDPVPPEQLFACYDAVLDSLRQAGHLESWRTLQDKLPIALDGTWYYSSQKIHCPNCSCLEHQSGDKTYYHSAVTPVLVAPGHPHAIPLRPEFITPQDGHTKQDCEIAASKRWLEKNAAQYVSLQAILLGDDLYAHQPFCRRALLHGFDFLFVCKPDSHTTLYQWVGLLQQPDLGTLATRVKVGAHFHTYAYRYANGVPLAEGQDALKVNGCELSVTDAHYRLIRATLPNRKTFFDDLRALTRYLLFPNWDALMDFMMRGLEIGPYAKPP
jgi:hypothetical protein